MNSLKEIFLMLSVVPPALAALAYVPLGLGYGQLMLGALALALSAGLTVLGAACWLFSRDDEPEVARGFARGALLAAVPLLLYILYALAHYVLLVSDLLT